MSLRHHLTIVLFLCFKLSSLAQGDIENPESLVQKTFAQRFKILKHFYEEDLLYMDSLTIGRIVGQIAEKAELYEDDNLRYEVKLMIAHFYHYRSHYPKEFVVNKILDLNHEAYENDIWWLKIRTHSLLANYYYYAHKEYANGILHFERTVELLDNVSPDSFPLKMVCIYQLGYVYYDFQQYELAKQTILSSLNEDETHHSYYYKMQALNTLGLIYRNEKKLDSSNFYFEKTLQEAKKANDTIWIGISSGGLGYNLFLNDQSDKARPLIQTSIETAKHYNDYPLTATELIHLAEIYIDQNDFENAENVIVQARKSIDSCLVKQNRLLAKFYPQMALIKIQLNAKNEGIAYMDSAFRYNRIIDSTFNSKQLNLARQQLLIQKNEAKAEIERQRFRQNTSIGWLIITILSSLLIILVLLFRQHRIKAKIKATKIAAERKAIEKRWEQANQRLLDFKNSLQNKNELINKIKKELHLKSQEVSELLTEADISKDKTLEVNKKLEQFVILTQKDWREFQDLFSELHPHFFSDIKKRYPKLSDSEIRIIALSKLKLDNKEMASLLGVGTAAIRQSKSRIRKKLNLDSNVQVESISDEF